MLDGANQPIIVVVIANTAISCTYQTWILAPFYAASHALMSVYNLEQVIEVGLYVALHSVVTECFTDERIDDAASRKLHFNLNFADLSIKDAWSAFLTIVIGCRLLNGILN